MRVIDADAFIDSINGAIKIGTPEQKKTLEIVIDWVESYAKDFSNHAEKMIEELSDCSGCEFSDNDGGCSNVKCLESRQKAIKYIVKFTGGNK